MTTRELIEAEIGKIPEERLGELYAVIRSFAASKTGSPGPGIMAKLREMRIEAPPDFAANLELCSSCGVRKDDAVRHRRRDSRH